MKSTESTDQTSKFANVFSSLGVFFVAIPLAIGIAMASGVPPSAGLIGAVVGGVVVGVLAGAPLVVSGPAAGMAPVVLELVRTHGLIGIAFITVFAGFFQVLFSFLKSGKYFNYIPKGVLTGMLSAIGVLIAFGQLHVFAGNGVPQGFLDGVLSLPASIGDIVAFKSHHSSSFLVGIIALMILIYWPKIKQVQKIPAVLPAVVLASLFSLLFEVPRVAIAPVFEYGNQAISNIFSMTHWVNWTIYLLPAFTVAMIASAESLLTVRAIDDEKKSKSNLDKELLAQGFGNITSGFLGGIPLTGVIVRSAANISFGATSRLSTILHGFWMMLFLVALPFLLEQIPLAALAAVLIVTGFKLFNYERVKEYLVKEQQEFTLWASTCFGIIFTNLLYGLGIGIGVALLLKVVLPKANLVFGNPFKTVPGSKKT